MHLHRRFTSGALGRLPWLGLGCSLFATLSAALRTDLETQGTHLWEISGRVPAVTRILADTRWSQQSHVAGNRSQLMRWENSSRALARGLGLPQNAARPLPPRPTLAERFNASHTREERRRNPPTSHLQVGVHERQGIKSGGYWQRAEVATWTSGQGNGTCSADRTGCNLGCRCRIYEQCFPKTHHVQGKKDGETIDIGICESSNVIIVIVSVLVIVLAFLSLSTIRCWLAMRECPEDADASPAES